MAMKLHFLFFLVLVSGMLGCNQPSSKERDPHFTSDAEELFFKNLRQSDYDLTENQAAGLNVYVHKNQSDQDPLTIKLIHNWRNDQAFILLEWLLEAPTINLSTKGDQVLWTGESMQNHWQVAEFIYSHHASGDTIRVDEKTLLTVADYHITTIKDFKKLTSSR